MGGDGQPSNKSASGDNLRQRKSSGQHKEVVMNGNSSAASSLDHRLADHIDRKRIVIWRRPFLTVRYFIAECIVLTRKLLLRLLGCRKQVALFLLTCLLCALVYYFEGRHQKYVKIVEKKVWWCLYWVGLGVLSSVGLGTGLHTFILYLGPHIAAVTLAAEECRSLDFPEPPYPDEIVCPADSVPKKDIGILAIMSKVRVEAFMWGAGTALGELPPYFMAKAARKSGDADEEALQELEELRQLETQNHLGLMDRMKLAVEKLVEKVGFFGILACASIPNPLFDLAGIICGHFLVPFWTFFGATLLGKAVIKMHIQKLFVIFAFDESHVTLMMDQLKRIPWFGGYLEELFREFLAKQKDKLHGRLDPQAEGGSTISWLFDKFVLAMVTYFIVSIINSMAQNYHRRLSRAKRAH